MKSKTKKSEAEVENSMFEFMVEIKMQYQRDRSSIPREAIKVVETIPGWSWKFRPEEAAFAKKRFGLANA